MGISAILIAVGGGTRHGDENRSAVATDRRPPGLIHLFDRPLVAHAAEDLVGAGVERMVVLADPAGSARIARALTGVPAPRDGLSIVEVESGQPLRSAVALAYEMLGEGPLVLRWADAVSREPATFDPALGHGDGDAVVLTRRWLGGGEQCAVAEDESRGPFHVGVYAFARGLPPLGAGNDVSWLDDALTAIEEAGGTVERRMVDDWWRHRGQPAPELDVNHFALEGLAAAPIEATVEDSDLVGAIRCDPSVTIRSSVIRGPVAIGPGAAIDNAFVGPFSTIGAGARIERAEIENSIVRERSVVADLGTRLESSVIGPDATISRDFRLPRGARLSVGRGARISL